MRELVFVKKFFKVGFDCALNLLVKPYNMKKILVPDEYKAFVTEIKELKGRRNMGDLSRSIRVR
jgi:hypothetical protein